MIRYLCLPMVFLFLFGFQARWKCLDDGVEDLISNPIDIKICEYSEIDTEANVKINIGNKATLVLTKKDIRNGNYILFGKEKFKINDKVSRKNGINYNYDLMDMHSFENEEGTFYLLRLYSYNGGNLNSKLLNLIVLFSKNKMDISLIEWCSGDSSPYSIGLNKDKLFALCEDVITIKYFEFSNGKFIYDSKNSTECRTDSIRKVWVPGNYGF